jgi:hypothetical protein
LSSGEYTPFFLNIPSLIQGLSQTDYLGSWWR